MSFNLVSKELLEKFSQEKSKLLMNHLVKLITWKKVKIFQDSVLTKYSFFHKWAPVLVLAHLLTFAPLENLGYKYANHEIFSPRRIT